MSDYFKSVEEEIDERDKRIKQLRELNAELLAHLRDALDSLRRDEPSMAVLDILAAIAKAEAGRK